MILEISIHALREEGDAVTSTYPLVLHISIHALREEGDDMVMVAICLPSVFLSTPSARRATRGTNLFPVHSLFLSTPSARRATFACVKPFLYRSISIHALREEGDGQPDFFALGVPSISIHALREEGALRRSLPIMRSCISIHALREEGD